MIVTEVFMNDWYGYGGGRGGADGYNGRGDYGGYKDGGGRSFGGADGSREEMERKMAQYSSMSRGALEDELAREAAALREKGMLDVGKLEEFCNMAAPFMTADQLRRMREIIDTLR